MRLSCIILVVARRPGGVTEWLKVTVLKTVVAQATAGSNPVPSANVAKNSKYQESSSKHPISPPNKFRNKNVWFAAFTT